MITYRSDIIPSAQAIVELFRDAALQRPVEDEARIALMYERADLVVTAWDGERLVGIARSLTDFVFSCYLSDLATASDYQRSGIGRKLIELTREKTGERCTLLLLSAPAAMEYYPRVGFERAENAFFIPRNS